jgi:hypothetical protein
MPRAVLPVTSGMLIIHTWTPMVAASGNVDISVAAANVDQKHPRQTTTSHNYSAQSPHQEK